MINKKLKNLLLFILLLNALCLLSCLSCNKTSPGPDKKALKHLRDSGGH